MTRIRNSTAVTPPFLWILDSRPSRGASPPDTGGKQKRCAGKPAQHKNMFHHTKNDSMNKYGKGTLANQGEMSYNIPCGYGLGAVV